MSSCLSVGGISVKDTVLDVILSLSRWYQCEGHCIGCHLVSLSWWYQCEGHCIGCHLMSSCLSQLVVSV